MGNNGEDNTDWLGDAAPPAVTLKGKNNAPFADGAGNSDDPVQGVPPQNSVAISLTWPSGQ